MKKHIIISGTQMTQILKLSASSESAVDRDGGFDSFVLRESFTETDKPMRA